MSTSHPLVFHQRTGAEKIQVRATSGRFNRLRWLTFGLTQILFYGLCWLQWDGRQAVLFNLEERHFYLFGWVLWPQDGLYLALLLIFSALLLFAVTAVFGRLFCGFACPQTTYTALFMGLEEWAEGPRAARIELDQSGWTADKLLKRGRKHLAWSVLALWTGITFVGYFTPIRSFAPAFLQVQAGFWETFWALFYGGFTYLQAGFMREKVCQHMCPYSRFQGVMYDAQTITVGYDVLRGEPRGALHRKETKAAGACVDCTLCVQVCPAGIDIRNGAQYECISCALCIDACDTVMDKIGQARGLIRFDSLERLTRQVQDRTRALQPRVLIYAGIMMTLLSVTGYLIRARVPLRMDVLRDRNVLARETDDGAIENTYQLRITNMSTKDRRFVVQVAGLPNAEIAGSRTLALHALEERSEIVAVRVRPEGLQDKAHVLHIMLLAEDAPNSVVVDEKTSFLIPQ